MVEKPVPKIRTSAGRRRPSVVTTVPASMWSMGRSTTSTVALLRAGYQSLEIRMRLQPTG